VSVVENPFQVVVSRARGTVVVTIRGELDTYTAPKLQDQLRDLIEDQGNLAMVLDLSKMTFVDSSGLSVLVDALKRMRQHGGTLTLASPTRATSKVLEISGLNKVFTITLP
jgi:anti-sigma B factor antagonist